jgi:hypothetical protein
MKNSNLTPSPRDLQALQARFALRVVARLNENAQASTAGDIGERLRFARERALERSRELRAASAVQPQRSGAAALLGSPWWLRLASFVPLVMLLAGLSVIEQLHDSSEISAAAEIDVALLADKLPPDAYRDPGFVEFLKTSQE